MASGTAGREPLAVLCTGSLGEQNSRFPCSKLKLDNLFLQWLSMQESQKLVSLQALLIVPGGFQPQGSWRTLFADHFLTIQVLSLLEETKHGRPLPGPTPCSTGNSSPMSPSTAQTFFSATVVRAPHTPDRQRLQCLVNQC